MAYIPQTQEKDELDKGMSILQSQVKTPPQAQAQLPQQPGMQAQPMGTIQPTMQNKQVGSGQYTNIKKYLEANRPAAQQMTQKVIGNVGNEAQKINAALNQSQSQLQQRLTPESQRLQQGQEQARQIIQQAASGQAPQDQQQIQQFQNLLQGSGDYQNIQLPDTTKQELAAQNLQNLGQNVRSTAGQQQLLQQAVKSSKYTTGQQGLDQLLLGGDKANRQALIQGVQQQVSNLPQTVIANRQKALEQLGGVAKQAQDTAKAVQEQYGTAQTGLKSDLENRLAQAQGGLAEKIRTGQSLNADELAQLGTGTSNLYGVNLPNYLTQAADISGIASKEDLAKANALSALSGGQQNLIQDLSKIGTYNPQDQLTKLKEAISTGKTDYEQAQKDLEAAKAAQLNALSQWGDWTGRSSGDMLKGGASTATGAKLRSLYTENQAKQKEAEDRLKALSSRLNVTEDISKSESELANKLAEEQAKKDTEAKATLEKKDAERKRIADLMRMASGFH